MANIVIADDNHLTRKIITKLLEKYPYPLNIQETSNGKDALIRLMESHYDLLFLDMNMPTLSGFNVANYIKQKGSFINLRIVVISAIIDEADVAWLQSMGIRYFIMKPIDKAKFDEVVLPLIKTIEEELL